MCFRSCDDLAGTPSNTPLPKQPLSDLMLIKELTDTDWDDGETPGVGQYAGTEQRRISPYRQQWDSSLW